MDVDFCKKCETYTEVEKHHILPKSIFGGIGPVVYLCPNCHTKFHLHLGRKNLQNPDPDYHHYTFWKWIGTATVILLCVLVFNWLS